MRGSERGLEVEEVALMRTNCEGLTWEEWLRATHFERCSWQEAIAELFTLRASWKAGEDPAEWRKHFEKEHSG